MTKRKMEYPLENLNKDVGDVGFRNSLLSVDDEDYSLRDVCWSIRARLKSISNPLPIQSAAIVHFHKRRDVLIRAEDGSGKTFSYLFNVLYWWSEFLHGTFDSGPTYIIIAPTDALCKDVHTDLISLITGRMRPRVALLTSETPSDELESCIPHDIVISTPNYVVSGIEKGYLQLVENAVLILDGIDMLISEGYEGALKSIIGKLTQRYPCWAFSNNPSFDVKILRNIIRRNPWVLTLQQDKYVKTEIFPCNAEQFYTLCKGPLEKFLHIYHILSGRRKKKIVIFMNSIDMCEKVKYFIRMVWPTKSIAGTDELLVRGGLEFNIIYVSTYQKLDKDAHIVINVDMPPSHDEYVQGVHCITFGELYSLVTYEEEETFYKIKSAVEAELGDSDFICPNPFRESDIEEWVDSNIVEVAKRALNRGGTSQQHSYVESGRLSSKPHFQSFSLI